MSNKRKRVSPLKGKTYLEIHGTSTPRCGFKKGELNIAKRPDVRKKKSDAVKGECYAFRNKTEEEIIKLRREMGERLFKGRYKKNKNFRSSLESNFAKLLEEKKIKYEYEKPVLMINGKTKYVDFVIDNKLYVEITGFAYDKWREDFIPKINKLRESVSGEILVLTYAKNIEDESINSIIKSFGMVIGNIEEREDVLKKVNFLREINRINKYIEEEVI